MQRAPWQEQRGQPDPGQLRLPSPRTRQSTLKNSGCPIDRNHELAARVERLFRLLLAPGNAAMIDRLDGS
jgi:hypothetical protein